MQYNKRKDMNVEGFKFAPLLLPRPPTNGNPRPGYTINDPALLACSWGVLCVRHSRHFTFGNSVSAAKTGKFSSI
jgi:hypothetical protein